MQRFEDAPEAYRLAVDETQPAEFRREYAAVLVLIGDREGSNEDSHSSKTMPACRYAFAPDAVHRRILSVK